MGWDLIARLRTEVNIASSTVSPLRLEAAAAIEELCDALHKALEWPISAEESDRLWQVLWKYGEGPPAIADRNP